MLRPRKEGPGTRCVVGEAHQARRCRWTQGRRRELQAAIQAHFKDWLLTSGNMRQVYDLARIENGGAAPQ